MPVIDYHNHRPPDQIADDINFENIAQAWLYGDHYKWRAMRINGVNEKYCTGNADKEKFDQWAATVPYTLAIHYITGRTWSCNGILILTIAQPFDR